MIAAAKRGARRLRWPPRGGLRFAACAVIAFAAFLSAVPPADAGERRRAGNIVFTLPDGWEAAELERGPDDRPVTVLRPEDWIHDDDAVSIWLPRGAPRPDGEDALRAWATEAIAASLDLDDDERLDTTSWNQPGEAGPNAPLLGLLYVTDTDDDRRKSAVVAVLIPAGDRVEVAYVTVRNRGDTAEIRDALQRSATTLLSTVAEFAFISTGAAPLLPPPQPGLLDGVWWGVGLIWLPGLDGVMTSRLQEYIYVFRPDGRFFDGIPPGGADTMDDPEVALRHTGDMGQYEVRGDTLLLRYASGERDEIDIDGALLRDGQAVIRQVRVPADGFRFAASRDYIQHTGLSAGIGESASVSSANTITFRPDGTFGRDGFVSAVGDFEAGGYAVNRNTDGTGTYTVSGGKIALRYDDGRIIRWSLLIDDGGDDGPTLWIGGLPVDLADGYTLPPAGEAQR